MTERFGLVGGTLGHSISPEIHQMIYDIMGVDGIYHLFEVEERYAGHIVEAVKTLGFKGINVTMPYKIEVVKQLDEMDEDAQAVGSANTVLIKDGRTTGYNTDYYGIHKTLEGMSFDPSGRSAVVMGNGGASKAVQAYLTKEGIAELTVVSIEDDWFPGMDHLQRIGNKDLIVNATPVGMHPRENQSLADEAVLSKFKYAFDVVYNPVETKFVSMAKSLGLVADGGLRMLVYQAIRAEEIWNGFVLTESQRQKIYAASAQFL